MIEIGGKPILWHIMKLYSAHGINDFIICCGYRGYLIKEFFANYFLHMSDVTYDLSRNHMEVHRKMVEPWRVTLVDTGARTLTGGRLRYVKDYIADETFCLTYGDGVADVNISELISTHRKGNVFATVTAVQPPGRFGSLVIHHEKVLRFQEKAPGDGAWINGGFFVLEPKALEYIKGEDTPWEREPMETLAREGQLGTYKHRGFWQCMDTLRDKFYLETLWNEGRAAWKVWQ
jgi:glucose-1-phosphate cytidylyltransferase